MRAANLAIQELKLRLESKQGSAISMATELARDERVRHSLMTGDRASAISAVRNICEAYAATTAYTATQRLRADRRFDALPIIALTAHAMLEEVERCAALGMNDHVTKPFNPEKLHGTLARHLPKP